MTSARVFNNMTAVPFFTSYPLTTIAGVRNPATVPLPHGRNAVRANRLKDHRDGQSSVSGDARVLYCDIVPLNSPLYNIHTAVSREPVKILISHRNGPIPFFHLPYQDNYNIRLTLKDKQNVGNVNFFLTEIINGCSVYVEGTRQQPTVYHINAIGTKCQFNLFSPHTWSRHPVVRWGKVWSGRDQKGRQKRYNKMDERFARDKQKPKAVRYNVPGLRNARKIEYRHYMTPNHLANGITSQFGNLQNAPKAPLWVNGIDVESMKFLASEGAVFGVRENGNWKFYVQKRVVVQYFNDGPPPTSLGVQQLILGVEEFWPGTGTGDTV